MINLAATEVDEAKIVRWVREGRIQGKSFPGIVVSCERCGKPIPEGRYCPECTQDLARGFSSVTKKNEEPVKTQTKAKFHIKY